MSQDQNAPTREQLNDLKAQAQFMQDELSAQGARELRETGKLSSPRLCEKAREFDHFMLNIQTIEERLEQMERERGLHEK